MKLTKALIASCFLIGGASVSMASDQDNAKTGKLDEAAEKVETGVEKVEKEAKKVVRDGKTAFFDMIDKESLTVGFEPGNAGLSDAEKSSLRAAVTAARSDSKLKRVVVAAWSDNELPRSNNIKLSKADKDLAENRAKNIEAFLKTLKVEKIDTYSMAEHANWFERMFKTDEAEIKKSMQGLVIDDEAERMLAEKLNEKGGPGKAAVILISEGSYLSH